MVFEFLIILVAEDIGFFFEALDLVFETVSSVRIYFKQIKYGQGINGIKKE